MKFIQIIQKEKQKIFTRDKIVLQETLQKMMTSFVPISYKQMCCFSCSYFICFVDKYDRVKIRAHENVLLE